MSELHNPYNNDQNMIKSVYVIINLDKCGFTKVLLCIFPFAGYRAGCHCRYLIQSGYLFLNEKKKTTSYVTLSRV